MFDIRKLEKEIALAMLKRAIAQRNLTLQDVADKIGATQKILEDIFQNNGAYYASHTLIFWTEIVSTDCTADDVLARKILRKRSTPPIDHFYNEIWRFISSLESEEKNENL